MSKDAAMSAEQSKMEANFKAYLITWRKIEIETMTAFAERGEALKKHGHQPSPPPLEIADYPGSMLLALVCQMKSSADGNGSLNNGNDDITALVESCINLEGDLKDLLKCSPQRFHDDEISRSNKIINSMRKMIDVTCSEFPAAVIAFECIARETDPMCELAVIEIYSTSPMRVSSDIRQYALRFMSYKGGEHFAAAAATMMGATREAKVMCEVLRKERDDKKDEFSMSQFIRNRTLGAMIKIYDECPDTEESTRISTAAAEELEYGML
ncbi:hypothetical protein QOZ80_5BG0417530 [Eleusine coracana subsp. coracana]|nr:hypothetical protein QOZ80_5BG0417530 [Eleusine coracana subsp. coracana]